MATNVTPPAAIQHFLESFSIPVYGETSVPDNASFPYITYVMNWSDFFGERATIEVDLWYRCEGEKAPNDKVAEIRRALVGGVILPVDGGAIWLNCGDPFCQAMGDPEDAKIRRRYIILTADFITN